MKRRYDDAELEAALRDVGARLAYPPAADLRAAVRARIERPAEPGFWAGLRSPRLAFVPALATVAILLVAALALQPVGARAAEVLGIRGLDVFFAPATPRPTLAPPTPLPGRVVLLNAVRVADVAQASRDAGFTVRVPPALGVPDEVYVRPDPRGAHVLLVYLPREGLPASGFTGIGALVVEARGFFEQAFIGKLVPPGGPSGPVTVNGGPGVWIEGAHDVFFRTPSGEIVFESVRLAGNVLAWEQGGLFIRLEAEIGKDEALRIASSMR